MIQIDGSFLEGGGQILRTSLGLSALTGQAFTISNIRKGRCTPGLQPQHLACVNLVTQLCNAKVSSAEIGSTGLTFEPKLLDVKDLKMDVGTAGSLTLLMQSALLPSMFTDNQFTFDLSGGTDVSWSQPYDYFANVLLPYLSNFAQIQSELVSRGYYPKGAGNIKISLKPKFHISSFRGHTELLDKLRQQLPDIDLVKRGKLLQIVGISHASQSLKDKKVAERQKESAAALLAEFGCPVSINVSYQETLSPCSGITLWAVFNSNEWPCILGADSLGELKKSSETVGKEAAMALIREIDSNACVDSHLADQLLPFMAFTKNSAFSTSEVTNHCKTNISVIEKFLPVKFRVTKNIIEII